MGEVKYNLCKENFDIDPYFEKDLRLEVSEAIHLHWRDVRILITQDQFRALHTNLNKGFYDWDGHLADIDTILAECKLPDEILLNPVVSLEEQVNGCVHFHYKDVRIEMPQDAFVKMAGIFELAKVNYFKEREKLIELDSIHPYDHIHWPTKEEWLSIDGYSQEHLEKDYNDHLDGINWMARYISQGFQIKPIIVTVAGDYPVAFVRRDGYKRYMAYKLLGARQIPCYVVSEKVALTMPQNKEFPFRGFSDEI